MRKVKTSLRNIVVDSLKQTPLEEKNFEIVERKGIGHPDTICDAIMDRVSVSLSKEYLERFGTIMHHNADKSLLVAGDTEPRFGGGIIRAPMLLIFGDRATSEVNGIKIPVNEIAIQAAKSWMKENLKFVDPEEHLRYQAELKPGSPELMDIFSRKGRVLGANDTSAAVGYAPMTQTETIVLQTERFINSPDFKKRFPMSGEDVKVMGLRKNGDLHLTVGMAFVDKYIESEDAYFKKKAEISDEISRFVRERTNFKNISIQLNTLDIAGRGVYGVYLTVLGTSAESGDSGQVGRGNRVNGVFPLNRPICSEAAAGKNPVSHVGKIYNLLTHHIANQVYNQVEGIREIYIWLLSKIGEPIDQPVIASAHVIMKEGAVFNVISHEIDRVIDYELEHIERFCEALAYGRLQIY